MYLYVPRGVQTEIIKNSLLGLSLVIVDLMRRLILTIDADYFFFLYRFFFAIIKCISCSSSMIIPGFALPHNPVWVG